MNRVLALPLVLALGCNDPKPTETGGLDTRSIALQVFADADGARARISVTLWSDDGSRLTLSSGDRLVVRTEAGDELEMRGDGASAPAYVVELAGDVPKVFVDFHRANATSARGTVVSFPPPFAIEPPTSSLRLDAPFTLRWSPSSASASMHLLARGTCVSAIQRTLTNDAGAFTINAADWRAIGNESSCNVSFHLSRLGGSVEHAPGLLRLWPSRVEQVRGITLVATR